MSDAFFGLLAVHVAAALLCAVVFWLPLFADKGGAFHRRAGFVYVGLLFVVTATAVALTTMSLLQPHARDHESEHLVGATLPLDFVAEDRALYRAFQLLLAYVAVVTFGAAVTGLRALKHVARPNPLEVGFFALLSVAGLAVAALGAALAQAPLGVVGLAGAALGAWSVTVARKVDRSEADRRLRHGSAMILSGVGAYSALSVVVANRVIPDFYSGPYGVVVWLIPATLGLPALALLRRIERRRAARIRR